MMLPPFLLCLFMGSLACACVVVVVYEAVLFITGAGSWETVSLPLMMGQLGAVFFGIFALGAWAQHKDKDMQVLLGWLLCGMVLELAALTGYAAHYQYGVSRVLVNHGIRTQGEITEVAVRSYWSGKGGRGLKKWFAYEFHNSEGKLIKGETGASYTWFSKDELDKLSSQRSKVPVLYLPENQQCHNIDNFWLLWDLPIILGILFIILSSVCLFYLYRLLRPARRKPRYKKRLISHSLHRNG